MCLWVVLFDISCLPYHLLLLLCFQATAMSVDCLGSHAVLSG